MSNSWSALFIDFVLLKLVKPDKVFEPIFSFYSWNNLFIWNTFMTINITPINCIIIIRGYETLYRYWASNLPSLCQPSVTWISQQSLTLHLPKNEQYINCLHFSQSIKFNERTHRQTVSWWLVSVQLVRNNWCTNCVSQWCQPYLSNLCVHCIFFLFELFRYMTNQAGVHFTRHDTFDSLWNWFIQYNIVTTESSNKHIYKFVSMDKLAHSELTLLTSILS